MLIRCTYNKFLKVYLWTCGLKSEFMFHLSMFDCGVINQKLGVRNVADSR